MGLKQTSDIINEALRELEDGSGASSQTLVKFMDHLSLRSNLEILIEGVPLEKLKENAEQADKNSEVEYFDKIIAVINHIHEDLVTKKQEQSSSPVPLPADFCCPLSLELMTDPVIVASGQTYEQAFIRKWIDIGLTVCPKTRQTLAHTNLIPNYTVKALIANWCESNNVKLPDPMKRTSLVRPSSLPEGENAIHKDLNALPHLVSNRPLSPESTRPMGSPRKYQISPFGIHREGTSLNSSGDEWGNSGEQILELGSQLSSSPSSEHSSSNGVHERLSPGHNRTASDSSTVSTPDISHGMSTDGNEVSSQLIADSSDSTGELASVPIALTTQQRECKFPPRLETRYKNPTMWRRPSDRFVPRIVSSPTSETRPDLSGLETQVKKLVEDVSCYALGLEKVFIWFELFNVLFPSF